MSQTGIPENAVWLVTGCSSGIGAALAAHIINSSHRLVATARKPGSLSFLPDIPNVLKLKLDVTSEADVRAVFDAALSKFGRIDVVVNNAGYGLHGDAEGIPEADARAQLETNFWGPVRITREAVRVFRDVNPKGAGGLVVQISSVGGFIGFPGGSFYHASKFGLEGFTEAFSREVHPDWNIRFLIAEPGAVDTQYKSTSLVTPPRHPVYANTPGSGYNNLLAYLESPNASTIWADPSVLTGVLFKIIVNSGSRSLPLRIPLGSDAWNAIKGDVEAVAKDLQEWADVSTSCSNKAQSANLSSLINA